MKIAIGNDHVALEMKKEISTYLQRSGYDVIEYGTETAERCDYPVYAERVARAVMNDHADCGILICGTGIGISIAANKVKGIRCCVCSEPYSARLSKEHNNTNLLAFGARVVGIETAKMIIDEWLATKYEGDRHQKRIDMIHALEN